MLDWFASKIGVLIFAVVITSVLLFFSLFQINLINQAIKVQNANNIARIMNLICENCSITVSFDRAYTIKIGGKTIDLDGINRSFLSEANETVISSMKIRIYKENGMVYAKAS